MTTRQTLTRDSTSMLAAMFAVDSPFTHARDARGAILIDRTFDYFKPLLNYLRTSELVIDEGVSRLGVLNEAKFFQLTGVIELLAPHRRADVTRSQLILHTPASLRGVSLFGVDLSRLVLSERSFEGAVLCEAVLDGANVAGSQFTGVSMQGARFAEADLSQAYFAEADCTSCVFRGARAPKATFYRALLGQADLSQCDCSFANFQNARARGACFAGANLHRAKFQRADLRDTDFTGAQLADCRFTTADMRGCTLDWAALVDGIRDSSWHSPTDRVRVTQAQYDAIPLAADVKARFRLLIIDEHADGLVHIPIEYNSDDDDAGAPVAPAAAAGAAGAQAQGQAPGL